MVVDVDGLRIESDGLMNIDDYYYALVKYRDFIGKRFEEGNVDEWQVEWYVDKLNEWYLMFRERKYNK